MADDKPKCPCCDQPVASPAEADRLRRLQERAFETIIQGGAWCRSCGGPVEEDRRSWPRPVCAACLEANVRRTFAEYIDIRRRLRHPPPVVTAEDIRAIGIDPGYWEPGDERGIRTGGVLDHDWMEQPMKPRLGDAHRFPDDEPEGPAEDTGPVGWTDRPEEDDH